jgi:hypothetical protein
MVSTLCLTLNFERLSGFGYSVLIILNPKFYPIAPFPSLEPFTPKIWTEFIYCLISYSFSFYWQMRYLWNRILIYLHQIVPIYLYSEPVCPFSYVAW